MKSGNKEAMRFPLTLALIAILASAWAPQRPVLPADMPLPASLRVLSVRHPALAVAKITGVRGEQPAIVARSYASELRGAGWSVELHQDRCAKACRWVPARRILARRGALQIEARLFARGAATLFSAEELRDQLFVAPRRQAKVNPAFFDDRMRRVKATELAAWELVSGKRLAEAASGLERAIALAADAQGVARRLHAERYAGVQTPLIDDARLRLGFVLAKQKRRPQAFEEWRKLVRGPGVVPAADAHPSSGAALKLLQLSLEDRAPGTRPTAHELALVKVLLTQPVPVETPVMRGLRPPMQLPQSLPAPRPRLAPTARPARRHRRFLFWQWTTKPRR